MLNKEREKMIEWLVDNDMDYLNYAGGLEWIRYVLRNGFDGYEKQTDEDLLLEILERDPDFSLEEIENA